MDLNKYWTLELNCGESLDSMDPVSASMGLDTCLTFASKWLELSNEAVHFLTLFVAGTASHQVEDSLHGVRGEHLAQVSDVALTGTPVE